MFVVGFIGAGKMALALVKGFLNSSLFNTKEGGLWVSAPSDRNLNLWREFGAETTNDNNIIISKCDIIFVAVKPHIFKSMVSQLNKDNFNNNKLFVSVMSGITLDELYEVFSSVCASPGVMRAMPNTPVTVGCGCIAISIFEEELNRMQLFVRQLFESVGEVVVLPERQQNAFAALAGSGPAFIYTILEALADGAVRMGLPRDVAVKFAAEMTKGAAVMSLKSGHHTGQLKDDVCSPGGTTICGVHSLENGGIRGIVMNAIHNTTERANRSSI